MRFSGKEYNQAAAPNPQPEPTPSARPKRDKVNNLLNKHQHAKRLPTKAFGAVAEMAQRQPGVMSHRRVTTQMSKRERDFPKQQDETATELARQREIDNLEDEVVGPTQHQVEPTAAEDEEVYWDAESRPPIKLAGRLNGRPLMILLDSRASGNYVSASFVKAKGLKTAPCATPYQVTLPSGENLDVNKVMPTAALSLSVEHKESIPVAVVDFQMEADLILGMAWLWQNNPQVDWVKRTISFNCGRKAIQLQGAEDWRRVGSPPATRRGDDSVMLSSMQCKRLAKDHKNELYIVNVTEQQSNSPKGGGEEAGRGHDCSPLVEEFSDVFPKELPAGVPPDRGVTHKIELYPGTDPPHKPAYRLPI